jgi:hypothetical protein
LPSLSWLSVVVLGGRLGPVNGAAPALDVAQLVPKHRHGLVRDLGAAGRALPSLLLVHRSNLASTSRVFHSRTLNLIRL